MLGWLAAALADRLARPLLRLWLWPPWCTYLSLLAFCRPHLTRMSSSDCMTGRSIILSLLNWITLRVVLLLFGFLPAKTTERVERAVFSWHIWGFLNFSDLQFWLKYFKKTFGKILLKKNYYLQISNVKLIILEHVLTEMKMGNISFTFTFQVLPSLIVFSFSTVKLFILLFAFEWEYWKHWQTKTYWPVYK